VEAAAVTAVYTFIVETFVYRDLRLVRDVPRVVADSGVLVGGVLLILGVALGFTNYLAFAEVPARAVEWVTGAVHSKILFLLLLNLFLLIVGMLMDIFSAIVVIVPLITGIALHFGVNPYHLGVVFLLGYPFSYLMGYPLAQNNLEDRNRWSQQIVEASPPLDIGNPTALRFDASLEPEGGLLVLGDAPFSAEYAVHADVVELAGAYPLVLDPFTALDEGQTFRTDQVASESPVYLDKRLLMV